MRAQDDVIDIWVVESALGHGGMGSVYRCHNREARRILAAVKVLDGELQHNAKARQRFIREAEILYGLDHPNIVKVRNIRVDADPPYLEMEYVEGTSLERRLQRAPLAVPDAVRCLRQLASALRYLHDRGIRHRDIKPGNIVLRPNGDAVLVDFGIAADVSTVTITERGSALGSAPYVPPEWARPGELDAARWDLYALGVSMYEALTGKEGFSVPADTTGAMAWMRLVALKQEAPALDPGPGFPVDLRRIVVSLTEPDWRVRIPSAEKLELALAALDLDTIDPNFVFEHTPAPRSSPTLVGFDLDEPVTLEGPPRTSAPAPGPVAPAGRSWGLVVGAAAIGLLVGGGVFAAVRATQPPPAGLPPISPPAATVSAPAPAPAPVAAPAPAPGTPAPAPTAPKPEPVGSKPEPAPVAKATPAPAAPKAAAPEPAAATGASKAGALVTNQQLGAWLGTHPDWQPDAARAAGKADTKFLGGWSGATPPPGKESSPASSASWALATAYCQSHGGLATVDAAPTTWELGSGTWHEFRADGSSPKLLRNDGTALPQPDASATKTGVGFRCRR